MVLAVALASLMAGCGGGQLARPELQVTAGAEDRVGQIAVRDATFTAGLPDSGGIAHRPGAEVGVRATFVNEGTAPDRLVSVSSPVATAGSVLGSGDVRGESTLTSASGAAAPPGATRVDIRLTGLNSELRLGLTYPVVFTFARAGSVRVDLPVDNPDAPREYCPLPANGKPPRVFTAPPGSAPTPPLPPPPHCSSLQ